VTGTGGERRERGKLRFKGKWGMGKGKRGNGKGETGEWCFETGQCGTSSGVA
jgi:hypothetical protein